MPDPMSAPAARPVPPPPLVAPQLDAPPVAPAPDAWQLYLDSVISDVDDARVANAELTRPPPARPLPDMLRTLVQSVRTHGGMEIPVLLRNDPQMLHAIALQSEGELRSAIRDAVPDAGRQGERVIGEVRQFLSGALHGGIAADGHARVERAVVAYRVLGETLPEALGELRRAPPATPEAALAQTLGVHGDAGDLARARERLATIERNLEAFAGSIAGFAWEPAAVPHASRRALDALGLGTAAPDSLAGEAAELGRLPEERIGAADVYNVCNQVLPVVLAASAFVSGATPLGVALRLFPLALGMLVGPPERITPPREVFLEQARLLGM